MPISPKQSSAITKQLVDVRSRWRMPAARWRRAAEALLNVERSLADGDPAALDSAARWLALCGPVRDFDGELPPPDVAAPEDVQIVLGRLLERLVDGAAERPEPPASGS